MGNREQKYIIGATISAIAVVLAFASFIPTLQDTTMTTSSTALNMLGHATVKMVDTDGNTILYSQSDNFVANVPLNNIQALLFASGGVGVDSKWLALCEGGPTVLRTATSCLGAEMAQDRGDGDSGANVGSTTKTDGAAGFTSDTLQVTITITASDSGKTFNELGLFTSVGGADLFAVAAITPIVAVPLGTQVGMTYAITIGGG